MRLDYRKAIEPTVELFADRDDYARKVGKEAPEWDRNRPISTFRIRPDALAAMNPGKKSIVLERTVQRQENGVVKRDDLGRVELGESEPLLRAWLAEPNLLPRQTEVNYGPYGSIALDPPLIAMGPNQGIFVGRASFGDALWFEDGTPDVAELATGGFNTHDRTLLRAIATKLGVQQ